MPGRGTSPLLDLAGQEAWADRALAALGRRRTGPYERLHQRPWATAARATTDAGPVWVKAHTPVLTREAPVTRLLASVRPGVVVDVLASDDDQCWLVTADAGQRLRALVPTPDELDRFLPVLAAYADLQRAAAPLAGELVAAGAFDRRCDRVADLVLEALDAAVPAAEAPYALSVGEVAALRRVAPVLGRLAAEGAAVVPDSIDHCDLHDGNVFVAGDRFTLADFGDSGVGNPFVSLVVLERSLTHRLALDPDSPELARLRSAYVEPWSDLATPRELADVARQVRPLGLLGRGLTWRALVVGVDDPAMAEFADGWPSYARELLAAVTPDAARR